MDKIKELEEKIEIATKKANESNREFVRTLYPEFTEEQVAEGADIFSQKMKDICAESKRLNDSLDQCETMEDVSAWRLKNNF